MGDPWDLLEFETWETGDSSNGQAPPPRPRPLVPTVEVSESDVDDFWTKITEEKDSDNNNGRLLELPDVSTRQKRKSGDKFYVGLGDIRHVDKSRCVDEEFAGDILDEFRFVKGQSRTAVEPIDPIEEKGLDLLQLPENQLAYDPAKSPKIKARRRLSFNPNENNENDILSLSPANDKDNRDVSYVKRALF